VINLGLIKNAIIQIKRILI